MASPEEIQVGGRILPNVLLDEYAKAADRVKVVPGNRTLQQEADIEREQLRLTATLDLQKPETLGKKLRSVTDIAKRETLPLTSAMLIASGVYIYLFENQRPDALFTAAGAGLVAFIAAKLFQKYRRPAENL